MVGIFLNRKNVIILLMAIELMLLAVNMNFIAFSHFLGDMAGQVFVFFILTVAAAESAIGLAILVRAVPQPEHDQRRRPGQPEGLTADSHDDADSSTSLVPLAPLAGALARRPVRPRHRPRGLRTGCDHPRRRRLLRRVGA